MKALFFIEIPTHQHTEKLSYQWYKKEQDNEGYGCNSLDEIKNTALNCEVILVLPDFNVIQKQITSKIKNRKKLEQAIAYELEDVLSEEIETLFFAYHPGKDKNSLDISIINRAWFEQWLEIFKQYVIPLSAVITNSMLLQTLSEDYLLIKKSDYYLLKTPSASYAIDNENINYFLTKLKESLPDEFILLIDNQSALATFETPLNLKTIPVQDCLLKLLAEHYVFGDGINLLQGIYKPKLKNDWQKIKWVAIGLFGLLLMATAFQGYRHWQLSRQEAKLDQQRLQIFKNSFPTVKRIVNPLAQMKSTLETLKQTQQQQGQFITMLAKVAIALREMLAQGEVHLLGMEFDGNKLMFKLNANSLALLEQAKQHLIQQHLNVEIESSNKEENQVNASFKISENIE